MLIAISGRAGSGKDTAADFLVKNHGFVKVAFADPIKRVCLEVYPKIPLEYLWGPSALRAKPLLAYPRDHGPWVMSDVVRCACCNATQEHGYKVQCHLTVRYATQRLGAEWGRDCYPNTWVDLALATSVRLLEESTLFYTQREGIVQRWEYGPSGEWYREDAPVNGECVRGVVIPDLRWPAGNEGLAVRDVGGLLLRMKRGEGLKGSAGAHESEQVMLATGDEHFDDVADNGDWELPRLESFMAALVQKNTTLEKNR